MRDLAAVRAAVLLLAAATVAGCGASTLVFGTATKFALDVSQRPDQLIELTLGYDRLELASIPAKEADARKDAEDTYSVLGIFSFAYGNPWGDEPLVIRQFFATGWAARHAAENPDFQRFFGRKTGEIVREAEREIDARRATRGEPR
jgi:hypothetical protein